MRAVIWRRFTVNGFFCIAKKKHRKVWCVTWLQNHIIEVVKNKFSCRISGFRHKRKSADAFEVHSYPFQLVY